MREGERARESIGFAFLEKPDTASHKIKCKT